MIARGSQGWQLVLADLALILFLVTLAMLAHAQERGGEGVDRQEIVPAPQVAASQALYRRPQDGPSLMEWLADQPADPRATLTIIAQHSGEDRDKVWREAQDMADSVAASNFAVRVIIKSGAKSDLYASLAYDAPQ